MDLSSVCVDTGMPLGDPNGGMFEYTAEGLPLSIAAAEIPVTDLPRALTFYTEALGMTVYHKDARAAVVGGRGYRLLLNKRLNAGVETGFYMGVENPYDMHRRLIDEGVVFIRDPARGPLGLTTSFKDPDGNILHAAEMPDRV